MTSRGFLALSAALLGLAAADRTLPGPASPADQPRWLANITAWAVATRAAAGYNGSVYDSFLPWTPALYIAPQSHIYDRFLYTPEGGWTPDLFLDDLQDRYGGIDGALLWASYPNMGVDEDSQFDVFSNLPGGLPAFAAVVARFHERGVRVGLPYNVRLCAAAPPRLAQSPPRLTRAPASSSSPLSRSRGTRARPGAMPLTLLSWRPLARPSAPTG